VFPFFFSADIVDFAGDKIINDVGEGMAGVLYVVKDAFMAQVDGVRLRSCEGL